MLANNLEPVFIAAFAVAMVLSLAAGGFFLLNKSAALKRKLWPASLILAGLLVLAFGVALKLPIDVLLFMAAALVLVTFLNLRTVKFCDSCGTTNMSPNPLAKPAFCHKCGAKLS